MMHPKEKPSEKRTVRRQQRGGGVSLGLTQHLSNGDRIAARRAVCGILWLGVMFLFIGVILLVTSKNKALFFKCWGGVIAGIGLSLVIICIILCIHAYCMTTRASQSEAATTRVTQSEAATGCDKKLPLPNIYGGISSPALEQGDQAYSLMNADHSSSGGTKLFDGYMPAIRCPSDHSNCTCHHGEKQTYGVRSRLFERGPYSVEPIIEEEEDEEAEEISVFEEEIISVHSPSSLYAKNPFLFQPPPMVTETECTRPRTIVTPKAGNVVSPNIAPPPAPDLPPTYSQAMCKEAAMYIWQA